MDPLSAIYGAAATWRRRWYAARAERTHRLSVPVISIGNLRVGGTGKTPTVACVARLLLAHGERPVILSRGYARQSRVPEVTVVSDRDRVLADVAHSGDEPMMLARTLPGVPVLVHEDRHRAGVHAEARFAPTVFVLDDGFQHLRLARDADLLLVDAADLADKVLPRGRLREPLANAAAAHAVIVPAESLDEARTVADRLGVRDAFALNLSLGGSRSLGGGDAALPPSARVFAAAAIARPERFFTQLRDSGMTVVATRSFRDHHPFSKMDVRRLVEAARAAGAEAIVTTEKDAIRLEGAALGFPCFAILLRARIEPHDLFASWLMQRLSHARSGAAASY